MIIEWIFDNFGNHLFSNNFISLADIIFIFCLIVGVIIISKIVKDLNKNSNMK